MATNAWLLTWVASLELKRPALIGTPVLDRGDCPMVAWFWLFTSVVSGDAGWRCPAATVKKLVRLGLKTAAVLRLL